MLIYLLILTEIIISIKLILVKIYDYFLINLIIKDLNYTFCLI